MVFWLHILVLLLTVLKHVYQEETKTFGPYRVEWYEFQKCKGPKKIECGKTSFDNVHDMSDLIMIQELAKDCPITKGKIIVNSADRGNKKKLLNYNVDNPCQHFVIGPFLACAFNTTKSNCKIKKGIYKTHINLNDQLTTLLGSNFFYGNYSFKLYTHNKDENVYCGATSVAVMKK